MPRSPKCPPSTPTSSSRASTRCGSKPRPSSDTVRAIDRALDALAQFAALEPGGAGGADEVADLAERPLEQPHRLAGALRGGRVRRERALEHPELRPSGENVLYRAVVL